MFNVPLSTATPHPTDLLLLLLPPLLTLLPFFPAANSQLGSIFIASAMLLPVHTHAHARVFKVIPADVQETLLIYCVCPHMSVHVCVCV